MYRTLIFHAILTVSFASLVVQHAKLGEKATIHFGKEVEEVQRLSKKGGVLLQACKESDENEECTKWKRQDGKFVSGGSPVRLLPNGDLVIEKTTEVDFASYNNPEEGEIVIANEDGSITAVLGPIMVLEQQITEIE